MFHFLCHMAGGQPIYQLSHGCLAIQSYVLTQTLKNKTARIENATDEKKNINITVKLAVELTFTFGNLNVELIHGPAGLTYSGRCPALITQNWSSLLWLFQCKTYGRLQRTRLSSFGHVLQVAPKTWHCLKHKHRILIYPERRKKETSLHYCSYPYIDHYLVTASGYLGHEFSDWTDTYYFDVSLEMCFINKSLWTNISYTTIYNINTQTTVFCYCPLLVFFICASKLFQHTFSSGF